VRYKLSGTPTVTVVGRLVPVLPIDDHGSDNHEHEADHHAVSQRRESRLRIALGLNLVIVVVQVVFGLIARSLGLLADAGHNLTDVAAVVLSLLAVRWARRRPTGQRSFGHHRATILAAQGNAAMILAATVLITYEATRRILHPHEVSGGIVVVVALLSAAVNLGAAFALREPDDGHGHGHDLNMRSAFLHMAGDAAASVGVALAGLIMLLTKGNYWLDPLVSIGVGFVIAYHAWNLLRSTNEVLLESTPAGLDIAELTAVINGMDGVEHVHDLHVWSLSSDIRALSAHVVLDGHPTLEEAQVVASAIKRLIGPRFSIAHATLELECESCMDEGPWCAIDDFTPVIRGHQH
jgi:cobalt-zinc-cadmium efflux system protein